MSTSSTQDISRQAGELARTGRDFVLEDGRLHRIHYHLLRLTLAGLTEQEVGDLTEYAALVFASADTTAKADTIRHRADASRLAVALVDVAEGTGGSPDGPGRVLLGAVLGAHAGLGANGPDDRANAAVLGAVGGAIAAATSSFVTEMIDQVGITAYLATDA